MSKEFVGKMFGKQVNMFVTDDLAIFSAVVGDRTENTSGSGIRFPAASQQTQMFVCLVLVDKCTERNTGLI